MAFDSSYTRWSKVCGHTHISSHYNRSGADVKAVGVPVHPTGVHWGKDQVPEKENLNATAYLDILYNCSSDFFCANSLRKKKTHT